MNNDQRLIPFLGGLVIGGAAGSQTGRYPYYNQYPAYYYPMYNNTPYYVYPNQYVQPMPPASTYYTYNDYQTGSLMPQDSEMPQSVMNQQRSINDLSFVPLFNEKN